MGPLTTPNGCSRKMSLAFSGRVFYSQTFLVAMASYFLGGSLQFLQKFLHKVRFYVRDRLSNVQEIFSGMGL